MIQIDAKKFKIKLVMSDIILLCQIEKWLNLKENMTNVTIKVVPTHL